MALAPLATEDDLAARNIVVPDGVDASAILGAVSSAIRDAAGVPITLATSTIVLPIYNPYERWIELPGAPVVSVASVVLAGSTLVQGVDYVKVGDEIFASRGWGTGVAEMTVTYTHGYTTVPADIIDLACAFASLTFAATDDSYGEASKVELESLGDYKRQFMRSPAGTAIRSPSPVDIPAGTRLALRARFGSGSAVVNMGRE